MRDKCKVMLKIFIKKYIATFFIILCTCSCAGAQTFVVTDLNLPDNLPEKRVQKAREEAIGNEVYLLFSDNDVRMTAQFKKSEFGSIILQKIGDNLYRAEEGQDVVDLELSTIFSYIKSCKISIYDKKRSGSSMVWSGTIILKRK